MKPRYTLTNSVGQPVAVDKDGLPLDREPGDYARTDRITGDVHKITVQSRDQYRMVLLDNFFN